MAYKPEVGERVAVIQDGGILLTGEVVTVEVEWGRRGYVIEPDDGRTVTAWERGDREFSPVCESCGEPRPPDGPLCPPCEDQPDFGPGPSLMGPTPNRGSPPDVGAPYRTPPHGGTER